MKNLLKSYSFLFIISGIIIIADQYTKSLVRANLAIGEMWSPWDWLAPYARIVHWWNTGVAFGMLQGMNAVFAALAVAVSIVILYYFPRVPARETILRMAMAMQLGGAVGNLIDRLTIGHVTDFISVGTFAVFNVADASISVGVGVLILGVWLQEQRQKQEAARRAAALENRPLDELASGDHEASG